MERYAIDQDFHRVGIRSGCLLPGSAHLIVRGVTLVPAPAQVQVSQPDWAANGRKPYSCDGRLGERCVQMTGVMNFARWSQPEIFFDGSYS